jgi:capsular exopolysaccharide synthesis family protein
VLRNLALGLALGLFVGSALTVLRRHLDSGVRSEADVRSITLRPVLGTSPFDSQTSSHRVVMHDDALGARSEAVRRLRTNLQFVDTAGGARCIVVTSSVPGEGKSTTALNLAVSLADAGQRVLLVDADLRRPSVAEYLGMEGGVGLTTVLIGRAGVADVVQPWQHSSLDILPAGQIPPNPSELLGSNAMSALLTELTSSYDTVLLDSPPLLPVTDAAVLSRLSAGALVVVGVDRIHRPQLRDAMESLDTVGATVLGVVLNKVTKRDASPYSYQSTYTPDVMPPAQQGPSSIVPSGNSSGSGSNSGSNKANAPGSEVLVARLQHGKLA